VENERAEMKGEKKWREEDEFEVERGLRERQNRDRYVGVRIRLLCATGGRQRRDSIALNTDVFI
jgi:hypothetical protein